MFTSKSGLDLGRTEDRDMGEGRIWIGHLTIARRIEEGKVVWGVTLEDADS